MPRKTKKEKIIRSLRRKILTLETNPSLIVAQERDKLEELPKKTIVKKEVAKKEKYIQSESLKEKNILIKRDLGKTLFLSALAIVVEIVLYWTTKGK